MTSSFCKFLLVSLLATTSVVAQSAAPTAAPTPAPKAKEGFVRFWNMLGKDQGEFMLIKENGTPEGEPLLSAGPGNYYASYIPVPPARYSLKIIRREDPATTLQTFDVLMRAGVYVTFIASLSEGKTKLEMLDDTFDPTTTVAGRLTIRHHFPNARVIVTTSTQARSRALNFGETEALDGFPLKPVELQMTATLAGGKTETWVSEVDFRTARHASLLILPDPYDRFRPRVSVDGKAGSAPTSD